MIICILTLYLIIFVAASCLCAFVAKKK